VPLSGKEKPIQVYAYITLQKVSINLVLFLNLLENSINLKKDIIGVMITIMIVIGL